MGKDLPRGWMTLLRFSTLFSTLQHQQLIGLACCLEPFCHGSIDRSKAQLGKLYHTFTFRSSSDSCRAAHHGDRRFSGNVFPVQLSQYLPGARSQSLGSVNILCPFSSGTGIPNENATSTFIGKCESIESVNRNVFLLSLER